MTAQIEQHPRSGVELSTPHRAALVRLLAMPRWPHVLAFLLVVASLLAMGWALLARNPALGASLCLLGSVCYLVGHITERCRHGD